MKNITPFIPCIIVTVVCWLALSIWLAWDELYGLMTDPKHHYDRLLVSLSFMYTLIPLVPAAIAPYAMSGSFPSPRWMRGLIGGVTAAVVVIGYFVSITESVDLPALLFASAAGLCVGVSSPGKRTASTIARHAVARPEPGLSDSLAPLREQDIGSYAELMARSNPDHLVVITVPDFDQMLPFILQDARENEGRELSLKEIEDLRDRTPAVALSQDNARAYAENLARRSKST